EQRMLADGSGADTDRGHDGLLALAALRGPALSPTEWRDIEATATSDASFADRLGAGLFAVPAANRDIFLKAAPASLRQFLVRVMPARKSFALSPAAQAIVAAWLAALIAGVAGAVIEPADPAMSTTDWLLLLAGAAALPALMLAV